MEPQTNRVTFNVYIPELSKAIKHMAVEQGSTQREIFLAALGNTYPAVHALVRKELSYGKSKIRYGYRDKRETVASTDSTSGRIS